MAKEKTTNIRIRNDLAQDLKEHAEDGRHPSLNGFVNELCRSYLANEMRGNISPGLMSIADALKESIGTKKLWVLSASKAISSPMYVMPRGALYGNHSAYYNYVGVITAFSPTTVEIVVQTSSFSVEPILIARADLHAWWGISVTQADIDESTFILKTTGIHETPDRCAVRREMKGLNQAGALGGFPLTPETISALQRARNLAFFEKHGAKTELLPLKRGDAPYPKSPNTVFTYEPSEFTEDRYIICGFKIESTGSGIIQNLSIGGSMNLLPVTSHKGFLEEAPVPFHPGCMEFTEIRNMPCLIFPNVILAEVCSDQPMTQFQISAIVVRVQPSSPLALELGYENQNLLVEKLPRLREAVWI